jgi:alkanesulfonate monooxygenase SsuD/methylene tetrahydromethanopterin reductase-like flavin-dependent oxidoreductase (luciferase family)
MDASRVRLGLIIPADTLSGPGHRYLAAVDSLLTTVTGHYDSAWCIDHLQGPVLEGWTTLTYLAARHPDLRWGHSVLAQTFRNPALVAKMAASFQFLSGGRFVLGIGAGGDEAEHHAYGYAFPPAPQRVAALDEALQIVKALWTQERATFIGAHHHVADASCEPQPDPLPPIMVGAFGPKMLRLTARHADWWNVSSTDITTYRRYHGEFDQACAEVGRDPASVGRVWSGGCVCAPTTAAVKAMTTGCESPNAYRAGEDFVGTPAQVLEQMLPFVELGVDTFLLDCGGFPRPTTAELLVDEVLPALNEAGLDRSRTAVPDECGGY